jgi:hypothetical protein
MFITSLSRRQTIKFVFFREGRQLLVTISFYDEVSSSIVLASSFRTDNHQTITSLDDKHSYKWWNRNNLLTNLARLVPFT